MSEEKKETGLALIAPKLAEVAEKLSSSIASVMGQETVEGFEKAYLMANAIGELKALLTPEYMKPIMDLQGNRLGFLTDKDKNKDGSKGPGYPEEVVKNCLIEAVLFGLQPTGNQFNIIASNTYSTKEGVGYLLSKIPNLEYDIVPELPRMKEGESKAAVVMNISWTLAGTFREKKLDIPVKVNAYMGTDAVIGKATRKARKWLYDTITGNELPEGEVQDAEHKVISSKLNKTPFESELERAQVQLEACTNFADVLTLTKQFSDQIRKDMTDEILAKSEQAVCSDIDSMTSLGFLNKYVSLLPEPLRESLSKEINDKRESLVKE